MRRTFFALLLVTAVALAMGMGAGGALAQENTTAPNETDAAPNASPDEVIMIDNTTRITEWSFQDGMVRITIQQDVPGSVTLTDALAGVQAEGATRVPTRTQYLPIGTHTVSMGVEEVRGGRSVSVATGEGTVRLSTGLKQQDKNPLETFGGESGLFTGVLMTVVLAALSAAYVVRSEDSGVVEA
jgi:hypothetical protein